MHDYKVDMWNLKKKTRVKVNEDIAPAKIISLINCGASW